MDVRRPWTSSNGAPIAGISTILDQSEARARPPWAAPEAGSRAPGGQSGLHFPFGWLFGKRDLPRPYPCLGERSNPSAPHDGPFAARGPPRRDMVVAVRSGPGPLGNGNGVRPPDADDQAQYRVLIYSHDSF